MDLGALLDAPVLHDTSWSIDVRQLDGDLHWAHRPDELLSTASVAKLFVLVEAAARIADGTVDPTELLDRRSVPPVADSGLWQHLAIDLLPVVDVAAMVGAVSDNRATNVLIDRLGLESVQQRASELAPGGSTLLDVVRDGRRADDPPQLSVGCAADWTSVFARLAVGDVVSADVSERVLGWLAAGTDLSMVASAFGLDPLSHGVDSASSIRLWNKTGTDDGVRADVGLVDIEGDRWIYAAICNWPADTPSTTSAVLTAMRHLGVRMVR